ncbi:hypothetical protein HD596_007563 [Nonomuraea jabiensis]|uniref:Uncharacterized protein n=2 Tax=Nonomuraea jabiensis TaxID=882448 RepID=A0A7W9LEF2_9ACTN|nr:hypothetical protein [Nonomuraea jabiensis]
MRKQLTDLHESGGEPIAALNAAAPPASGASCAHWNSPPYKGEDKPGSQQRETGSV